MTNSICDAPSPTIAIIGCGLAGAALSWQATLRGWKVKVFDRSEPESCSRVAAGLVTPITGGRAAASWQWESFFPVAQSFYKRIETLTGCRFWNEHPALRVFQSQEEHDLFVHRWPRSPDNLHVPSVQQFDCFSRATLHAPYGVVQMQPAARLETKSYLEATRQSLLEKGALVERDLDCNHDIILGPKLQIHGVDEEYDAIVFCQGFAARENKWFSSLPLHPARGDILRITTPSSFPVEHVIHHAAWIVPDGHHELLVGATYDRQTLDGIVDERAAVINAREALLERFRELLAPAVRDAPLQIRGHRAAVRPASYDRHPLLGRHSEHSSLYCLNGLGSKGSLMSPLLAKAVLDYIAGTPLPSAWDWRRKSATKKASRNGSYAD